MYKYLSLAVYVLIIFLVVKLIRFLIRYFQPLYIGKSEINGNGLFANKDYKKGDIIIEDLFSNNTDRLPLNKDTTEKAFLQYISIEGAHVNHCSHNYNCDIITKDNIYVKAIASKDIRRHEEITANYDLLHNKFEYIGSSESGYKVC